MSVVCDEGLTAEQSEMVQANLGLIGYLIDREMKHLIGGMYAPADAFQDGVFGLARAVQKFDPTRGYKFSTYAMPHIRQSIQRGRGRSESVEWRRAYAANTSSELVDPLSLDYPEPGVDGVARFLIDTLEAPSNPAAEVESDLASTDLADGLRAACRDDVDRDVVESLIRHCATGARLRHGPIGLRHGLSADAVRLRLRSTLQRYRDSLEETAP